MQEEHPRLVKIIEAAEGINKVYENGLLESTIYENAHIDVAYVTEGKRQLEEMNLGKKFYVVSEGAGFYRITKEARALCASREYATHLAAVAVMVNHVATKLMLDLYLKIDKPVVPTRAFTSKASAVQWLYKLMDAEKSGGTSSGN